MADRQELAAQVWQSLFGFFIRTRHQRDLALERLQLTPNDAKALTSLEFETGKTMHSLAEEWRCDASNATWMVDRLEKRGLAERRSIATDRRVKLVVLTDQGEKTKSELMSAMNEAPPELLTLDDDDLMALAVSFAKLDRLQPTASGPLAPDASSQPTTDSTESGDSQEVKHV